MNVPRTVTSRIERSVAENLTVSRDHERVGTGDVLYNVFYPGRLAQIQPRLRGQPGYGRRRGFAAPTPTGVGLRNDQPDLGARKRVSYPEWSPRTPASQQRLRSKQSLRPGS